jgi:type VI secretion system protein ImpA
MFQVRKALQDGQTLAQQILQRKGPPPAVAPPAPPPEQAKATSGADGAAPPATAAHRVQTREDLLNRLADASAQLLQLEPQSPIAYMIQRAVKLARLPLPELMKVLVRDPNVLGQLDRDLDLGIERGDAAKKAAGGKK